jgi:hypothetical protein
MPEHLSLDESGRLVPEGDAGTRWLSARVGRWRIMPAADDLFLLRRDPVEGEGEGVRAILTGDLQGFALGELLAFLSQSRWTGVINVAGDGVEKSIFIKQGAVKWAASNQLADRLGEVVVRLGMVSEKALEDALSAAPGGSRRIGQVLLQSGLVDAAGLYRALKHQVEEIFFSTLIMERGLVFLFNDPVETRFAAQISLDLNGLLMDGLRRIDELGYFRKRIPGSHCHVARRDRDEAGLNDVERRVLAAVDGRRTVGDISTFLHMGEFDTTKILFGLAEAGYIEVNEEKPEASLGSASRRLTGEAKDVVRVFNTIFREIFDDVARMAPTAGYRLGADAFLSSDQHGYADVLAELSFDEEGQLSEEMLLSRAAAFPPDRVPDPARHLCDALNEVMFFCLFQAGELLPVERDEDLSRRVKAIYELLEK